MNLLVDMNLPPAWLPVLEAAGHKAVHWSAVGNPRAPDAEVMRWAGERGYVVFTHDLDFGALLAVSGAHGPSVIQIRTTDVTPGAQRDLLLRTLVQCGTALEAGALVSVDESRARVRVLPLRESSS